MSAALELLRMGVEVQREDQGLCLLWHCEPTPELRALVTRRKAELLAELAPKEEEASFLPTNPPSDPVALEEFEVFTATERYNFYGCRAVCLEEGLELHQAERNAVAAVLQHRRLKRPLPDRREEVPFLGSTGQDSLM